MKQTEGLLAFARPARRAEVQGFPFEYVAAGRGRRTLLLLPGLLGDAASLAQQVIHFEPDYRVLVINYPDTPEIGHQLAAIDRMLAAEGVERVALVGQTLGGFLAQAWARRSGQRVEALALVHAGLPNPRLAAVLRRDLIFARLAPWPLWRRYLLRVLLGMVSRLRAAGEVEPRQAETVAAHLRERFASRLSKPRVLARYRLLANLHRDGPYRGEDFPGLAGKVLMLHSQANAFTGSLPALQAVYPGARVQTMGEGHNISLQIKPQQSNRLLRELLDSVT